MMHIGIIPFQLRSFTSSCPLRGRLPLQSFLAFLQFSDRIGSGQLHCRHRRDRGMVQLVAKKGGFAVLLRRHLPQIIAVLEACLQFTNDCKLWLQIISIPLRRSLCISYRFTSTSHAKRPNIISYHVKLCERKSWCSSMLIRVCSWNPTSWSGGWFTICDFLSMEQIDCA